ncbi:MAG: hypothetical protein HY656_06470 [Acidobacteria bacterium]|nr:hypothetical protein [Acidobacteriota bacterium]
MPAALILLTGALVIAATPAAPPEPSHFDSAWARDSLWDDGQAEVALYAARRPQYGKIEAYEAVFIVVKEDFSPQLYVKADPPYEGKSFLPVLKLNAVHSYWTANYPYHFLASVFVRRDAPAALVKLTVGSQEWCGNTFKEVRTWGGRPELVAHTYFDGEGDSVRRLDLRPGDLLEDQLPLALRSLRFQPGLRLERRVFPSLISNNLRRPFEPLNAAIEVVGEEAVSTPAGRLPAWKITVQLGELQQTWWFEKAAPHALLKMESSDGRAWQLKARTRKPYWQAVTYRPEM